ncbi:MAG: type II toxin-antitoxin system RelE/ParE family toxin [Nanoarchaeota archaeon]|nr:type II toxin-antitoxin system RelE/ParE family toxin [Nanoarchaeota archaeon]
MVFKLNYSSQSRKFLRNLDKPIFKRIIVRLEKLEKEPIPSDSKFIGRDNGERVFRYRIGNYRVLYKIKEKNNILLVSRIDKRQRIYN